MSRNRRRSWSDSEHPKNNFVSLTQKNSPVGVHSPRAGLIAGPISNHLHRTPVAVAISASGERTICAVKDVNTPIDINNTNPFADEHNDFAAVESTSEDVIQKCATKKQKAHLQRRRKEKERRRTAKIILTHRNSVRQKPHAVHKCVSVQTDFMITGVNRPPEYIGDPGKPSREVSLPPRVERRPLCGISELTCTTKKFAGIDNFFAQFIPESLKVLSSFVIMIVLIFWLTSIILDVEVPSDFFRMASNYVRSFKWGYYHKQPQTNAEKCLEYLTRLFR